MIEPDGKAVEGYVPESTPDLRSCRFSPVGFGNMNDLSGSLERNISPEVTQQNGQQIKPNRCALQILQFSDNPKRVALYRGRTAMGSFCYPLCREEDLAFSNLQIAPGLD